MTDLIQSLDQIAGQYEALYCDLWGCLHNGRAPFPAAVSALQGFRQQGGTVLLLTNAPRPASYVAAQLQRLGVPRDTYDLIVSSGDAAQYAMLTGAVGRKVYHIGPEKDGGFFTEFPAELSGEPPVTRVPLAEAEGIVCTGPFDEMTETPEDYRATFLYAKTKGLKMLCANPDLIVDFGDRRIYCAGALAALYEEMGGEALYFGKPHPPIYDLARLRLTAAKGREIESAAILAIGDGYNTDIEGAVGEGIDAAFVTGGIAADAFGADADAPDIGSLNAWLAQQPFVPRYAIAKLR